MATTTWNPSDKDASITLSSGNLVATGSSGFASVRATTTKASGKWYWEITANSSQAMVGIANASAGLATFIGADANGQGYYGSDGQKFYNGSASAYGGSYLSGDVVSCLWDADAQTIIFWRNGTAYASIDISAIAGDLYPALSTFNTGACTANFGASAFAHTPTSGFLAYNDDAGGGSAAGAAAHYYRQMQ